MNKEQLQFFYNEIMGLFGWDDGDEASGVDPLWWVKREYEIRNVKLAQLRAELKELQFSHGLLEKDLAYQEQDVLPKLRAELDELRLALKVAIVCNAEQKSWGVESPFQKRLDGLVGKFEYEKVSVSRDDIAEGYCCYCETPLADAATAREHGKTCEKHPLRAELAQLRADVETWKKYYYDVADAITRESTSPTDLCNQARQLRASLALSELATEEQIKINSALLQRLDAQDAELDKKENELNDYKTMEVVPMTSYEEVCSAFDKKQAELDKKDAALEEARDIMQLASAMGQSIATAWLSAHPAPQEEK